MSKKVLVIVDRGMVDKTSAIVWEHEIPILEEIHGEGSIIQVDPEKLTDGKEAVVFKGTAQVVPLDGQSFKLKKNDKGVEVVEITTMNKGDPVVVERDIQRIPVVGALKTNLGIDVVFAGDAVEEYGRLEMLYGGHAEQKTSNVQVVYGRLSEGRFEAALGLRARRAA